MANPWPGSAVFALARFPFRELDVYRLALAGLSRPQYARSCCWAVWRQHRRTDGTDRAVEPRRLARFPSPASAANGSELHDEAMPCEGVETQGERRMVRVFARPGRASSSWVGIARGLHPYGRASRRGSCRFGRWPVDSGPAARSQAVTALQGMLALNQAGHLQAVELLSRQTTRRSASARLSARAGVATDQPDSCIHAGPDGLDRCFRRPAIPRR